MEIMLGNWNGQRDAYTVAVGDDKRKRRRNLDINCFLHGLTLREDETGSSARELLGDEPPQPLWLRTPVE